jgi:hypothetical protein
VAVSQKESFRSLGSSTYISPSKYNLVAFGHGGTEHFRSRASTRFEASAEILLEDFFKICPGPNHAEALLLMKACHINDIGRLRRWCKYPGSLLMIMTYGKAVQLKRKNPYL